MQCHLVQICFCSSGPKKFLFILLFLVFLVSPLVLPFKENPLFLMWQMSCNGDVISFSFIPRLTVTVTLLKGLV